MYFFYCAVAIALVSLSSCATGTAETPIHVDGQMLSVKIYRRDDPPSVCRELSEVEGVSGTDNGGVECILGSRSNALARLRRSVLNVGGNAVLMEGKIKEPVTPTTQSLQCMGATDWQYVAKGIAFYCPPGATE